jgi:hypothetical protein
MARIAGTAESTIAEVTITGGRDRPRRAPEGRQDRHAMVAGRFCEDPVRRLEAVHHRHPDVHHDDIGTGALHEGSVA